jgi:Sec-independent protein translocase protein TatA
MEILGVGPLEFLFIIIIALIVLGPSDMVKAGKTLGKFLRNLVTSPTWSAIQQTSRELRYLPNKLIRDAGLEEVKQDLQEISTAIPDAQKIGHELKLQESIQTVRNDLVEAATVSIDPIPTPEPAPEPELESAPEPVDESAPENPTPETLLEQTTEKTDEL